MKFHSYLDPMVCIIIDPCDMRSSSCVGLGAWQCHVAVKAGVEILRWFTTTGVIDVSCRYYTKKYTGRLLLSILLIFCIFSRSFLWQRIKQASAYFVAQYVDAFEKC